MMRQSWCEQHPVLLGLGIVLGTAAVAAFWPVVLATVVLGGVGYGLYRVAAAAEAEGQLRRVQRKELLARADYEHWLLGNGHPAGVHGRYPPVVF